jgi:hypothetical protein
MNREIRLLVMDKLGGCLRNYQLKFKTAGILLPIVLHYCIYGGYLKFIKENQQITTSIQSDSMNGENRQLVTDEVVEFEK